MPAASAQVRRRECATTCLEGTRRSDRLGSAPPGPFNEARRAYNRGDRRGALPAVRPRDGPGREEGPVARQGVARGAAQALRPVPGEVAGSSVAASSEVRRRQECRRQPRPRTWRPRSRVRLRPRSPKHGEPIVGAWRPRAHTWTGRPFFAAVFDVDSTECPRCGGTLRFIATVVHLAEYEARRSAVPGGARWGLRARAAHESQSLRVHSPYSVARSLQNL